MLRVLVADERGRRLSAPGVARWLARVAPARARGTLSLALVSDAKVRALNREYRGIDRVTDVLSFSATANSEFRAPSPESRAASLGSRAPNPKRIPNPTPRTPNPFLGDIVIARGVARRQARAAGHSELTELRVLALHGLLHLLGYDHERDGGRMRKVERRLRRKGGLREGLIERTAPGPRASMNQ
jgi:probable rRNA maturation factor